MNKKKILVWGYYGQGNFGDDYNLKSLIDNLKKLELYLKYDLYYTSYDNNIFEEIVYPFDLLKHKGKLKFLNLILNFYHTQKFLSKVDIIIFGGGTQYFECGKNDFISFCLKYLHLFLFKLRQNRKIIQLNIGIGSIQSKYNIQLFKQIIRKSDYVYLRDIDSYKFVKKILPSKNNVYHDKDLSYYYNPHDKDSSIDSNKNAHLGINLIDYYNYFEKSGVKREMFIEIFKDLIEYYIKKGFSITIFPMQLSKGGFDDVITADLMKKLNRHKVNVVKYKNNIKAFHSKLSKTTICVGMRYHFSLIAIQNNIPTLGISYQPKVRRTFEEYKIDNFVVEMNAIDYIELIKMIDDLLLESEAVISELYLKNKDFEKTNKNLIETLDIIL